MYVKVLLTLLVAFAAFIAVKLAAPPRAGESAAPLELPNPLDATMDELRLDAVPLERAVAVMREKTGANVVVRWERLTDYGVTPGAPVEAHLRGVTLAAALEALFTQVMARHGNGRDDGIYQFSVDYGGGVVTVSEAGDVTPDMLTRVYDVRDLIDDAFFGPAAPPARGQFGRDDAVTHDRLQSLRNVVESCTPFTRGPMHPRPRPDGQYPWIDAVGGRLVIVNTAWGHRAVERLLRDLRRTKGHAQRPG